MLAREGYRLITGAATIAVVLIALGFLFGTWAWGLAVVGVVILCFTVWFFRDPVRVPPPAAATGGLLLAPADGKVVELVYEEEPLYIKGPAQRVSIFLSPLNVHVNRSPCDGVVEYTSYVPGEYLVAWHPKASEKNERSQVGVRHPSGTPVMFKQIAGAVARRIVFYLKVGDTVQAGERYGIVKFGSRMDILVPPDVQIDVKLGQKTTAGITVIGRLTAHEDGVVPAVDRAVAAARAGGADAAAAEAAAVRPDTTAS